MRARENTYLVVSANHFFLSFTTCFGKNDCFLPKSGEYLEILHEFRTILREYFGKLREFLAIFCEFLGNGRGTLYDSLRLSRDGMAKWRAKVQFFLSFPCTD